jgi:hypothetical protein
LEAVAAARWRLSSRVPTPGTRAAANANSPSVDNADTVPLAITSGPISGVLRVFADPLMSLNNLTTRAAAYNRRSEAAKPPQMLPG